MSRRKATTPRSETDRKPVIQPSPSRTGWWWPVRIAGAWIAMGGALKTFTGLPSDLPVPILSLDLDPLLVLTVAAAVELLVGTVAIVAPRLGWLPVTALLGLFITILAGHWWQGGGSCGCFGTAVAFPAWLMLAIDAVLLGGTLATIRRQRCLSSSASSTASNAASGSASTGPAGGRLPRFARRCLSNLDVPAKIALGLGLALALAAALLTDRRLASLRPAEAIFAVPAPDLAGATVPKAWSMPTTIPEQVLLRPSQWTGKPLAETEFGRWVDVSAFPAKARMIVYYESCNHCADHLRELAAAQDAGTDGGETFVLAQLPTPKGYTGRLHVDRVPRAAAHVSLPDVVKAYVITPPWDVFLENGRVVRAERVKWSGEKG